MSIDAVITGVSRNPDGTANLHLGPRQTPHGLSCPGQSHMTVVNPPPHLEAAVGTEIWGNCSQVLVGDTKWAERIGYTRLRLMPRP